MKKSDIEDILLLTEEALMALSLSEWMEMVRKTERAHSVERWEAVRNHMMEIRTRDDIRYDYLEMQMSNYWVSGVLRGDSIAGMEQLLRQYADANMRYARQIYTPAAFEGDMAILPAHIRGAVFVEQALECGTDNVEKTLICLGRAVREWAGIGDVVKDYATLLGEEATVKGKEARAVVAEIENPVLSIALLVSNRKDTIQKCLDSLTPIREAVPAQLILVDTGCDADLRALLEQYGDIVTDFTWCNDFSKARNESLKYATGEWYLYLDDDEWFVETQDLIDFFVSGDYKKFGRASYIQRNFLDMEATQYTDAWVSRMTKLHPDTHFESKIHEYMMPSEGDCRGVQAIVHHFGYVFETEEALRKHYERNRILLEEMIEEEPDNLRWRIQLAQEYRSVKECEKLYALGEECLELTKNSDNMYDNIAIGGFYGAKILARREEGNYEDVFRLCKEAEDDRRNTELCKAFLALNAARAGFYLGKYQEAEKKALEYIKWKNFFAENEPILYLQKPVPFVGECLDLVMIKEGYSLLICSGLKQGNTKYLDQYLEELHWEDKNAYIFEEMAATLIEAMNTLPGDEVFERTLRVMFEQKALWDYFTDEVCAYEESGNCVTPIMELIERAVPEALAREDIIDEDTRNLAAGVKEQLHILIENGMKDQARTVFAQVRSLLPRDEELVKLEKELME